MSEGEQSLWFPFCTNEIEQNGQDAGNKYGNKCNNRRLKNGELILAVARHIIRDYSSSAKSMACELLVTARSVNEALRKIRDKIAADLFIPGLSDLEMANLCDALINRERFRKQIKDETKEKEIKNGLIDIMRDHVIKRMHKEGNGVADIARVVGISRRAVRQVIAEAEHGIPDLIREMFWAGRNISQIAELIGLPKREIKKILGELGYNLRIRKYLPSREVERRTISTIKPCKPRNSRTVVRRATTVSREGLADWNKMHYDSSGHLRLPYGCVPPADLPRKFPSQRAMMASPAEPRLSFYPAPPPSRADCSRQGRIRIGYMRFY
ncbi:MAG: hypothetical protein ACOY4I_14275 [Bacillota bacterium]